MNTELANLTPAWLGPYVDEVLTSSTDFGHGDHVTIIEPDSNGDPLAVLVAAPTGIVMGEWDGPGNIAVEFVPWSEVSSIGISDSDLAVSMRDGNAWTVDMADLPDIKDAAQAKAKAREIAVRLIALLNRAVR